ncbi:hypothetical protein J3R82DRAFT_1641 [Butyriboletus roseoflavus]|nr:hypothetical protein J3R82DRAFT_1641 [Butyriboletus roseoflavus]
MTFREVTGIGSPYIASRVTQNEVFGGSLSQWITSFYASTLATNLSTTRTFPRFDVYQRELLNFFLPSPVLLAYRIWSVDRQTARLCGDRASQLRPVLHVIVDAGVIYSATLLSALICFANQSNGQYVILNMDRRSRRHVQITTFSDSKDESVQHSSMLPMTPMSSENSRGSKVKFDDVGEVG